MKKSLLTLLVLLVAVSSFGQSWMNTGNALQRQTNGTYSNFRFNLGSPGFMYFYNKTQTDSLFNIAVGSGVTSFNTRTGAITLLSVDVTTALGFTPVPNTRQLINGYGVLGGGTLATDRTLVVDTTSSNGIVSKPNLASQMALKENTSNKTNTISSSTTQYTTPKAVQDYTYAKAHIDSAVNNARTQVYYASLTSGNTLTNSALQNVNIIDVSRSSADYYSTGSTSPTGSSFYYNPTVGSILFQDSFTSSGEPVKVQYTTSSISIGGTSVPILTYATMAAIAYPTPNCFIVVNANEDQDGLRWVFYAPSGTTDKTQLQAIASTLNNF